MSGRSWETDGRKQSHFFTEYECFLCQRLHDIKHRKEQGEKPLRYFYLMDFYFWIDGHIVTSLAKELVYILVALVCLSVWFYLGSLAKEVMFLVVLVCMSVCLFVDSITHTVINGLG